jgi:hypothetical protein
MLGVLLHAPRVPFIALRQLGAVGDQLGRQFLPSVEWCTGQSGAPPDNHCSCPVRDLLPYRVQPTVAPQGRLAHHTLSGAPSRPLERATCRALIARTTVGTGAVGSPDSLVHHQTVRWMLATSPFFISRDRRVRRGWLTAQSGAPPYSPVIYSRTTPSIPKSSRFNVG